MFVEQLLGGLSGLQIFIVFVVTLSACVFVFVSYVEMGTGDDGKRWYRARLKEQGYVKTFIHPKSFIVIFLAYSAFVIFAFGMAGAIELAVWMQDEGFLVLIPVLLLGFGYIHLRLDDWFKNVTFNRCFVLAHTSGQRCLIEGCLSCGLESSTKVEMLR